MHHNSDPQCPSCEEKLKEAHPYFRIWYPEKKKTRPDMHISWSYRGEEAQNQAVLDHRSHLLFPHSPHNYMEDGKPCSMALDLFEIDEDGVAVFSPGFYARLYQEIEVDGDPILWGGVWKTLGDSDHFQLNEKHYLPPQSAKGG